jgi:hypothetical protein
LPARSLTMSPSNIDLIRPIIRTRVSDVLTDVRLDRGVAYTLMVLRMTQPISIFQRRRHHRRRRA